MAEWPSREATDSDRTCEAASREEAFSFAKTCSIGLKVRTVRRE